MKRFDFREKIYQFLIENEGGATASQIAEAIDSNRMTVTKYLDIMKGQDLVTYKGVGMAKLWTIQSSPIFNSFDKGENYMIRKAMDLLGEGVAIIDRDLRIIWYNEAIARVIGELKKNKGKRVTDFYDESEITSHAAIKTFSTGQTCKSVQPLTLKDGKKHYFDFVTNPIKDKKGNVIAIIVLAIDLSDYKRKMDELRALLGK
ncbi:PAS domain-containing protein [Candidatus Woesearchaeota archaeon]|nr:PAS domain-containing protein [Candidatus Woesearchaeota archaeon]